MAEILTVYFSRRGQNYWKGGIRDLPRGNTEIVAEMIREAVGGDLFRVETVRPYAADYYRCTEEARQELRANARPALKACPETLDAYDTVFVGYPNWWGTMPMAMAAFLERYDLSGKRLIPFCTNEGSGLGRSVEDLRSLCPAGRVERGLSIPGHLAAESGPQVMAWARQFV